ncbi:5'-(N(7)-methyl 5'-triphosphoguanosine)-[mRNA] diphosphatase [Ascochyta rabiei]|uniref:Hydrolase n=1 Tax=Didymella rabiei TaxID=5454 RepID=A0A163ET64_DIDRA|nr:5'-(N(7)-methyl 5'-triphosphoguanosine)-[mRNA] diphosphatase [Ascochyta rabiei]KZM23902.1 hydrolase [Ascochyta rabiei]UPX18999.1 5'-(N(7)-methyl 5'-triphosphoguanosine)-[mRNA] diphosphatase [Ascochyta rabiei]
MTSTTPPDVAAHVESLIPKFQLTRLLNSDQAGRRISLLGTIDSQEALLIAERAAFDTSDEILSTFPTSLRNIKNLGANDIYAWFLANSNPSPDSSSSPPDYKLNLIYPCTAKHVKKYEKQGLRIVHETPEIYARYVKPYIAKQHERGTLQWVYNILDGAKEQDDVIYRETGDQGFLLLPDLNWDRKTLEALHLLGIVERRDIRSVRDLRKHMLPWLTHMRRRMQGAAVALYPQLDPDQLKLYVHYQPTYYHFHVHIVHVALEAGSTQATGKALGLENVISQLDTMAGDGDASLADASLSYHLGERSELWEKIYLPLKEGREVAVDSF